MANIPERKIVAAAHRIWAEISIIPWEALSFKKQWDLMTLAYRALVAAEKS